MQNFEVKYTIRLYDPTLISELANQFEKEATTYRNKNEFFTHIIELGLQANRKDGKQKAKAPQDEKSNLYPLIRAMFNHMAVQFKTLYVKLSLLERLNAATYNLAVALNNGETLFNEKVESGFYDDVPTRCKKILADLMAQFGLDDDEDDEDEDDE
jgi:hypothetical protein